MEQINYDAFESYSKIVVIGVGGAGNNAVNRMIDEQMHDIDFWVCNTDIQTISSSKAEHKLLLGPQKTKGLGAGGDPEVGRIAAEDSSDDIKEIVEGADIVFIAAGMGGGTGTGAAPVIAKIAKDAGALTIAIVTRPFAFEGEVRRSRAVEGIKNLKEVVDSILVVSNDKLMMMNGDRPLTDGFHEADKVLSQSVKTITDIILIRGIINLDLNDIRNGLQNKGYALIGFGTGKGPNKAIDAVNMAISSPLLEAGIHGAKTAIVNVTFSNEVTMYEANEVINYIKEAAGTESNINVVLGIQQNSELKDEMYVSVIATDLSETFDQNEIPQPLIKKEEIAKEEIKEEEETEDEEENILPSFLNKHNDGE